MSVKRKAEAFEVANSTKLLYGFSAVEEMVDLDVVFCAERLQQYIGNMHLKCAGKARPSKGWFAGGWRCDYCGGQKSKVGDKMSVDAPYDECSQCHLACYCTPGCQLKHWQVHKEHCRAPGDYRVDDYAWYFGQTQGRLRCADLVRMVAPVPPQDANGAPTATWSVRSEFSGAQAVVDARDLEPCLWGQREAAWKAFSKDSVDWEWE